MASVRIDKWLWAARFFKTRALASKACDLGRIASNGVQAKPAREVRVGDKLTVRNEGGEFQIEVLLLSEMRGPAAVGQNRALRRASSWLPSARRCRSLRRCRNTGPRNATAAASSSFVEKDNA